MLDGCGEGGKGDPGCVSWVSWVSGDRGGASGRGARLPGVLQARARFLELSLSLKHWDVPA